MEKVIHKKREDEIIKHINCKIIRIKYNEIENLLKNN